MHVEADTNTYPRGIKTSDTQMAVIAGQFKPAKFSGEWNYTVKPTSPVMTRRPASNPFTFYDRPG